MSLSPETFIDKPNANLYETNSSALNDGASSNLKIFTLSSPELS